jgi:hypothetical protein
MGVKLSVGECGYMCSSGEVVATACVVGYMETAIQFHVLVLTHVAMAGCHTNKPYKQYHGSSSRAPLLVIIMNKMLQPLY